MKIHQLFLGVSCFFETPDSWCPHNYCSAVNLRGLDTNLLLNNMQIILVKIIIMPIFICLSNSFFNSIIKMKNKKQTAPFPFFMKMKKEYKH